MIKGRLFVVNSDTLETTKRDLVVSVFTPDPNGKQWLKTISDIMADMLQTEVGDYVFLWERRSATKKSQIHGVYRVISKPYYELASKNDHFPFKINIEPAFIFNKPLDEYEVLNCPFINSPLWTITGKKVAGKSRGTSPLSQDEVKHLITLLIGKNPDYSFIPFDETHIVDNVSEFEIDYSKYGYDDVVKSLNDIDPNDLCFFDMNHNVKYEKILETIFNQEMSKRNAEFFDQIGVDVNEVSWFSNYLPYSIEQSEMDYVIIESADGITNSKMFLIEFMKTPIDIDHIDRSILYSKWVNDTLALGESVTQPIIICNKSYDFLDTKKSSKYKNNMAKHISERCNEYHTKMLQIFTYDFSGHTPQFTRKL